MLGGQGQIAGSLVGNEHTDLRHQLAEILDAGVLITHDGELMGNQRVIHYMNAFSVHCFLLRNRIYSVFGNTVYLPSTVRGSPFSSRSRSA